VVGLSVETVVEAGDHQIFNKSLIITQPL